MSDIILSTDKLTKSYKLINANEGISLQINKGDIYGFIGVNGAGKTTFMKMICGLIFPTSGSFSLMGASSGKELELARRKTGVLIEHPALYTDMTALQNLVIQGRYKGLDEKRNVPAYKQILEKVGLADAAGKKVRTFSMGMKQRLGLALCLVGDPEFIILDEPYVSLDPVGVNDFRRLLLELNKEGLTILFSCHTLSEMTKVATRYGFLHRGRLRKEITSEKLEDELKSGGEDLEAYFLRHIQQWDNR
jgi:ABC-2 type transport system ATP-binding protein